MKRFFRLSGAGNDFLAVAEPDEAPDPEHIRDLCRRGLSLGADGIFHLSRRGSAVRLRHWNADGSRAELCVNGTRCAARLAFHLGWATAEVEISTEAGPIRARDRGAQGIEVELPAPGDAESIEIETENARWKGWRIRVGVPHFVVAWEGELKRAPVDSVGPLLRAHPSLGSEGANVDFVSFDAPHGLALRTFERGVEGETLACGSGVIAAVAVGVASQELELPVRCQTRGGCVLEVSDAGQDPQGERWSLLGDARLLAEGILQSGASSPC